MTWDGCGWQKDERMVILVVVDGVLGWDIKPYMVYKVSYMGLGKKKKKIYRTVC